MKRKTELRASTSIPYEIKVLLDSLESADQIRLPNLSEWARSVFIKGRKFERATEEIADWVEKWALEKGYSQPQIRRVLHENKATRHPEKTRKDYGSAHVSTYNYVARLKDLVGAITGLEDKEVEKIHMPSRLAEDAQSRIIDITAQTSPAESAALLKYVQEAIALLQRLEQYLKAERKGIKLGP